MSAPPVPLLAGRQITQIGVLVPELERAMAAHAQLSPSEGWHVVEPGPRRGVSTYRGRPLTGRARLAFSPSTPEIELIEYLDGDSVYSEWLTERGHGLHHLAVNVEHLGQASDQMAAAGFNELQGAWGYGPGGSGGHAYYDTVDALGYILEAIEPVR